MMALLVVFARAGIWQLERAGEKEDLQARFAASNVVDPETMLVANAAASEARFRKFEISGHYDSARQILLDNMTAGGQNGYHVLTPFVTADKTVMVNRGWVKADPDRSRLPDVGVDIDPRTITGRLNRFPLPGIRLEAADTSQDNWPRRLLFPTGEQIAANLGYDIAAYQLLLDPQAVDGYLREWKAVEIGPERNLGYAVQWFALAALTVCIYLWLGWRYRNSLRKD
jgi:surfeit locus 1 family protein